LGEEGFASLSASAATPPVASRSFEGVKDRHPTPAACVSNHAKIKTESFQQQIR